MKIWRCCFLSLICLVLCAVIFVPSFSYAADVHAIYMNRGHSDKDPRVIYKKQIIEKILEVTEDRYGPLELRMTEENMERTRQLQELVKGISVQVGIEATKVDWEEQLLPVYIPVDKGLTGWRICIIRKKDQDEILKIKTLEELKKVPTGSGTQWSSTKALLKAGFNVVDGNTYDGLFKMLNAGRFVMFPRGINEAFEEVERYKGIYPDLSVDTHIAVVMPLPMYIFVTPKRPDLQERFEVGLKELVFSGWLDEFIDESLGDDIRRANLKDRLIFYIDNPNVSKETTPFDVEEYWFKP